MLYLKHGIRGERLGECIDELINAGYLLRQYGRLS